VLVHGYALNGHFTALLVADDRTAATRLAPPPQCHGCALPVSDPATTP
jgi:hypothetical protein